MSNLEAAKNRAIALSGKTCSGGTTMRQSEADCITLWEALKSAEAKNKALVAVRDAARALQIAMTGEPSAEHAYADLLNDLADALSNEDKGR